MKDRIIIKKARLTDDSPISFFLQCDLGELYLFTRDYNPKVFDYFRYGRSMNEVFAFSNWSRNRGMNKIIERLPSYVKYAKKEALEELKYINDCAG